MKTQISRLPILVSAPYDVARASPDIRCIYSSDNYLNYVILKTLN